MSWTKYKKPKQKNNLNNLKKSKVHEKIKQHLKSKYKNNQLNTVETVNSNLFSIESIKICLKKQKKNKTKIFKCRQEKYPNLNRTEYSIKSIRATKIQKSTENTNDK